MNAVARRTRGGGASLQQLVLLGILLAFLLLSVFTFVFRRLLIFCFGFGCRFCCCRFLSHVWYHLHFWPDINRFAFIAGLDGVAVSYRRLRLRVVFLSM